MNIKENIIVVLYINDLLIIDYNKAICYDSSVWPFIILLAFSFINLS